MLGKPHQDKDCIYGRYFIKFFFTNNTTWCNISLTFFSKELIILYGCVFNPTIKPRKVFIVIENI
jgi:hypothetical protein